MTESLPPAPAGDILAWLALASTRSTSAATLAASDLQARLQEVADTITAMRDPSRLLVVYTVAWLAAAAAPDTSAATLAAPDARHQLRQAGDIIRYLRIATDY